MDSRSDVKISQVLNILDINSIIKDVTNFIEKVAGRREIFDFTYTTEQTMQKKLIITNTTTKTQVASIMAYIDESTDLVKKCTCLFEENVVELTSKGDLIDYLFLSLCPSMCIVRSIMYLIEICKLGMDPKSLDNQLRVSTKANDQNPAQTNICIYGKGTAFVELQLSSDMSHFVCFPNGRKKGIPFQPFLSIENTPYAWYLEKAFANQHTDNLNAVPCPQTLQAMEIIFNLIGVEYAQATTSTTTTSTNSKQREKSSHMSLPTRPNLLGG
jgi:hypothetical protein